MSMREWIQQWNIKIYKDDDGKEYEGTMGAEELWKEFGIKSAPLFKDQCFYHVPGKWADDVRIFIKQVQKELGDKITFEQIKEKWCGFTVYFQSTDEEARQRLLQLEEECINRLISKGIYPSEQP